MQYAISNWIYGDEPLRAQYARLARFGYDGIELVGEPARYNLDEVKQLSEEFGVEVSSVLGWSIWGIPGRDSASPDESERFGALEYRKSCIDLAGDLGVSVLVVLPAPAGRTAPTGMPSSEEERLAGYQNEWDLAVDSLRGLAAHAKRSEADAWP